MSRTLKQDKPSRVAVGTLPLQKEFFKTNENLRSLPLYNGQWPPDPSTIKPNIRSLSRSNGLSISAVDRRSAWTANVQSVRDSSLNKQGTLKPHSVLPWQKVGARRPLKQNYKEKKESQVEFSRLDQIDKSMGVLGIQSSLSKPAGLCRSSSDTGELVRETVAFPEVGSCEIDRDIISLEVPEVTLAPIATETAKEGGNDEMLVIHVYDDARNGMKRDFVCSKNILIKQMRYFAELFDDVKEGDSFSEQLDIAVHCDIEIFKLLVDYVYNPEETLEKELGVENVVALLVAAEFLKMDFLQEKALRFFYEHVNDVVRLPLDFGCLSEQMVDKLASFFKHAADLEGMMDKKMKLVDRLYRTKVKEMCSSVTFYQCRLCGDFYTESQWSWQVCSEAQMHIDFYGNAQSKHISIPGFFSGWQFCLLLSGEVESLEIDRRESWRSIYWMLFGWLNDSECSTCGNKFVLKDLHECWQHPEPPVFHQSSNRGVFPCCGEMALRFNPCLQGHDMQRGGRGCRSGDHVPVFMDVQIAKWNLKDILVKFEAEICRKFTDKQRNVLKPSPPGPKREDCDRVFLKDEDEDSNSDIVFDDYKEGGVVELMGLVSDRSNESSPKSDVTELKQAETVQSIRSASGGSKKKFCKRKKNKKKKRMKYRKSELPSYRLPRLDGDLASLALTTQLPEGALKHKKLNWRLDLIGEDDVRRMDSSIALNSAISICNFDLLPPLLPAMKEVRFASEMGEKEVPVSLLRPPIRTFRLEKKGSRMKLR